jgi:hypothetical protein
MGVPNMNSPDREHDLTPDWPPSTSAGQVVNAAVDQCWQAFFCNGPAVSDDALPERASQEQSEREPL